MLFNEPKLLKCSGRDHYTTPDHRFSALQRAEIAEILRAAKNNTHCRGFSALQRAEIAEIHKRPRWVMPVLEGFSALQRAEIAEILP